MPKARRRKVDPADRLSDLQERILHWIYLNQPPCGPQGFAPWNPSLFIGENPTPSQTNALSTTLKRLEERGLLNRYSITYKNDQMVRMVWGKVAKGRIRTSHVQLNREGFLFVESLFIKELGPDGEEIMAKRDQQKLQYRVEGLRFALNLINERIQQGMDADAERVARRARFAVTECLNQLADMEGG